MLQFFIVAIVSFVAGILVGAGAYYRYVNHIWRHYPEQFRFLLNRRIGDRHACEHVMLIAEYEQVCSKPAINQCEECKLWFCDDHFNQAWKRCLPDSELKAVKEQ